MAFLKNMWKNNSKHKKLLEELALQNNKDSDAETTDVTETDSEITFKLKYLGSTVIEKMPIKENLNTEAVKKVLKASKASKAPRKKLQRVNLTVSLKGITVVDLQGNELLNVSIYRISNCSTDATQKQIFSFISTDQNETMECHAFMCSKRKMAEAVTMTVAEAFATAYSEWQAQPQNTKNLENNEKLTNDRRTIENNINNTKETNVDNSDSSKVINPPLVIEEKLIDLDSEVCAESSGFTLNVSSFDTNFNSAAHWVCFEDDFNSAFSNEAERLSRNNHTDLVIA